VVTAGCPIAHGIRGIAALAHPRGWGRFLASYLVIPGQRAATMQPHVQKPANPVPATGEQGPPFRVSFIPGGIEVVAKISDLENAEELIKTINALKLLLKPSAEIKKPEGKEAAN